MSDWLSVDSDTEHVVDVMMGAQVGARCPGRDVSGLPLPSPHAPRRRRLLQPPR